MSIPPTPRPIALRIIPESTWETGRQLARTQIHGLLARVWAAAKEETPLALLLRGEYEASHKRWPFVGLYRPRLWIDNTG